MWIIFRIVKFNFNSMLSECWSIFFIYDLDIFYVAIKIFCNIAGRNKCFSRITPVKYKSIIRRTISLSVP